jgi:hypothetical protein
VWDAAPQHLPWLVVENGEIDDRVDDGLGDGVTQTGPPRVD